MGRPEKELRLYPKRNGKALSSSKQKNFRYVFREKNHSGCYDENKLEEANTEAERIGGKLKRDVGRLVRDKWMDSRDRR